MAGPGDLTALVVACTSLVTAICSGVIAVIHAVRDSGRHKALAADVSHIAGAVPQVDVADLQSPGVDGMSGRL